MLSGGTILGATKALWPAVLWLGGMIVLVVVTGLVILKMRASMFARESGSAGDEGLLAGLRRMRDTGEISPDEYDAARKNVAARARSGARPSRRAPAAGEKRARPGFDLTGAPLPDQPAQDAE